MKLEEKQRKKEEKQRKKDEAKKKAHISKIMEIAGKNNKLTGPNSEINNQVEEEKVRLYYLLTFVRMFKIYSNTIRRPSIKPTKPKHPKGRRVINLLCSLLRQKCSFSKRRTTHKNRCVCGCAFDKCTIVNDCIGCTKSEATEC